jgi:hypothetical protein
MSLKFLVIFTVISLFCQVVFGIYYSIAIVDQNTLVNSLKPKVNQLTIDNQQLEIQFSVQNSLSNFLKLTKDKPHIPITSTIKLD